MVTLKKRKATVNAIDIIIVFIITICGLLTIATSVSLLTKEIAVGGILRALTTFNILWWGVFGMWQLFGKIVSLNKPNKYLSAIYFSAVVFYLYRYTMHAYISLTSPMPGKYFNYPLLIKEGIMLALACGVILLAINCIKANEHG